MLSKAIIESKNCTMRMPWSCLIGGKAAVLATPSWWWTYWPKAPMYPPLPRTPILSSLNNILCWNPILIGPDFNSCTERRKNRVALNLVSPSFKNIWIYFGHFSLITATSPVFLSFSHFFGKVALGQSHGHKSSSRRILFSTFPAGSLTAVLLHVHTLPGSGSGP